MAQVRFADPGIVVGVLEIFGIGEFGDEFFKLRDCAAVIAEAEEGVGVLQKGLAVEVFVLSPFPLLDDIVEMVAPARAVGGVDVVAPHQIGVAEEELGFIPFDGSGITFDEIFERVNDVIPRLRFLRAVLGEGRRLEVEIVCRLVLRLLGLGEKERGSIGHGGQTRDKSRGRKEEKDPRQQKTDLADVPPEETAPTESKCHRVPLKNRFRWESIEFSLSYLTKFSELCREGLKRMGKKGKLFCPPPMGKKGRAVFLTARPVIARRRSVCGTFHCPAVIEFHSIAACRS